jgi:hypothetical protein
MGSPGLSAFAERLAETALREQPARGLYRVAEARARTTADDEAMES